MSWLSKILFPRAPRDVQRRKLKALILWVVLGLILSAAIAALLYFSNRLR